MQNYRVVLVFVPAFKKDSVTLAGSFKHSHYFVVIGSCELQVWYSDLDVG